MQVSNEQLYTPRIVSIAPIHYQNEKLRANEHLKERYLAEFLQLTEVSLQACYKLILDNEIRLRNCSAHVIELDSKNFVKMVLVDAAFVVMILLYNSYASFRSSADRIFGEQGMMIDIAKDMLLLENQLPFFILEDLLKLSRLHDTQENSATLLACEFLRAWATPSVPERIHLFFQAEHILDLLRKCLMPEDWRPEMKKATETTNMPHMKELYQVGVKIRVGSMKNMFDIRFHNGTLKIPPLSIFDETELIFGNLLALEICHYPREHIFSDYVEMMRLLTLSSEDTELLIQNGVIHNKLPNAERVTTLFHNIGTENLIYWFEFCYSDVVEGLLQYHRKCEYYRGWQKWKEALERKYFKLSWAICSVSAAALLLVLTIIQTVCSILQVIHK